MLASLWSHRTTNALCSSKRRRVMPGNGHRFLDPLRWPSRRGRTARSPEQGASDRFARLRHATEPAARQRPQPDAEIDGAASSWRLAPRQAHGEHRTLARLSRHGHVAAHHARELAREGKTEPRPAELLSGRGIGLAELLEQLCLLLRSHANAGVSNG